MNQLIIDRMRMAAGDLWEQAMTHPSGGREHNQRLEFLGSGVLNLALADLMYHRYEGREGRLSMMCDHLSSEDVLNEVGRKIGLDPFLKFEMSTYRKPDDSVVTSGVKAVIGAVHERAGYNTARGFVEELLVTDDLLKRAADPHDPISELKEWLEGSPWKTKVMDWDDVIDGKRRYYHTIEFCNMSVIGMGPSRGRAEAQASRLLMARMSATAGGP